MNDSKFLTVCVFAMLGLGYCLWKTQIDYRTNGLGWTVAWGVAASFSAFFFVAFLLAGQVLSDL